MTTHLTKLLCTRLCHDITGPIGAVNNGAELMAEGGDASMAEQAMELIAGSAKEAVNRIQFFRQSYGLIKFAGNADMEELRRLTDAFLASTHASCKWPADMSGIIIGREQGQLLMNLIILAHSLLIRGGTISITCETLPDGVKMVVSGEGPAVKVEAWLEPVLAGKMQESLLDSKSAQAYFAAQLAQENRLSLSCVAGDTRVELIATPTSGA